MRAEQMKKLLFLFFSIFLSSNTYALEYYSPKLLSKNEAEIFLNRLAKDYPDNKRTIETVTDRGLFILINKEFFIRQIASIWKADINNDGLIDYAIITHGEGSGHYDHFESFISDVDNNLKRTDFALQRKGYPSNVSNPPIVYEDGITYIVLEHIWAENKDGESVYAGANSNAARDAHFLLREKQKYYIKDKSVKLVNKTIAKFDLYENN